MSGDWDQQPKRPWGRMWRTGRGQVSGDWDQQPFEETLGEGCGGLDRSSVWRLGQTTKETLGKDVEDWTGQVSGDWDKQPKRPWGRMWRTGQGQVSGDWDEQPKIPWGKDVEDWTGSSVWRLGQTTKDTFVEGCGGLDGVKCLEIGMNSRRSADVYKIHQSGNFENG